MKTVKKLAMMLVIAATLLVLAVTLAACGESGGSSGGTDKPQGGRPTQDVDPYVKAVEIVNLPYKTEYLTGEKTDLSGLKFNATWILDGEEEVIEMVAADLDGYTPGRNDALTTDITEVECIIGGYTFSIAITVSEQQADIPVTDMYTPLRMETTVSGSSTTNVKNNGRVYGTDIVYDHVIYDGSGLYEYDVDGKIDSQLRIQGNYLYGKQERNVRTKVHYLFSNTGSGTIAFRYYYEMSGINGMTTPTIRLDSGETVTIEFVVDTDKYAESTRPWVVVRLADNASAGKLVIGAYEMCEFDAGTYELALDGATFADGTTEKMLAAGEGLPDIAPLGENKELIGWYDVTDPGNRYIAGEGGAINFTMPEDDLRLAPIVRKTEYADVSLKPRTTSGGKVPEVYIANNTSEAGGTANYSTDGYSETNVLYTLYAAAAGTDIVSGCGNHIGNNFERDRVVKLTVTWKSGGNVSFTHWLDYEFNNEYVRAMTTADITVSEDAPTAVVYYVVTRDYVVNNSNTEAGFHMRLIEELTEDTSFEMTCEYAYISD